jgi:DNA-binding response OmpR family regulator
MERHILVVEDDDLIRTILLESLADAGFMVVEAADGEQAVQAVERDDIHLILTDINMPGRLDGVAVAQVVRKSEPSMPVIFVTGRPDERDRALQIGPPTVFIEKPFNLDRLVTVVHMLMQEDNP